MGAWYDARFDCALWFCGSVVRLVAIAIAIACGFCCLNHVGCLEQLLPCLCYVQLWLSFMRFPLLFLFFGVSFVGALNDEDALISQVKFLGIGVVSISCFPRCSCPGWSVLWFVLLRL